MLLLKDKVALITGASRGIGSAIALAFAQQGAIVAGTATTEEGALHITKVLKQNGLKGQGFLLNLKDNGSIRSFFSELKLFGSPCLLVNNAAVVRDNLLLRMKEEEWETVIETNLSAVFKITQWCLKSMLKARFGRIINIASIVGCTGNLGQTNYAASKAGLIGLSKSLAQEVASRHITVNVVAPGFIETDMTRQLSETQRNFLIEKIPLGSLGSPKNVADACVFLASDQADYVTGQTLHVNGGMYMN